MDIYHDVHRRLKSGEVGPSTSHSAICHGESVLRMEATASHRPSFEGLCIAHNIVNEFGELNDSRLLEGDLLRLRDPAEGATTRSNVDTRSAVMT